MGCESVGDMETDLDIGAVVLGIRSRGGLPDTAAAAAPPPPSSTTELTGSERVGSARGGGCGWGDLEGVRTRGVLAFAWAGLKVFGLGADVETRGSEAKGSGANKARGPEP
mmetsp:Transcript_89897/g.187938  ORF Transcript_89897/g.187938 Transcript_89897/m.187938 type:complete len:111 (-) Transcript_89897:1393-1725(-)